MAPSAALTGIANELRNEASAVSPFVVENTTAVAALGELVAAGPRTGADPAGYAHVIELVREGYLLHYGTPRLFEGMDADLALLAGDYLYAKGLERLSAIGDVAAVAELADLIATSARIHAAAGGAEEAAAAGWLSATLAIAVGEPAPGRGEAKAKLDTGDPEPLLAWAAAAAAQAGLGERLQAAAEAIGFRLFDRG